MSKEHKNKRDTKKKAAMSPKEKKAAKQLKKETKNILGNWTALSGVSNICGIDAPEKKQAFGKKSKENLSFMIAGKNVEVEYDKRDRYGRIIGKLIMNGQDINLLQIKHGYAWHYKYYEKDQSQLDRTLYSSAEIEAREKTIGLWSAPAVAPWEYRKK